jgi:hypothetical protein
VRWGRPRSAAGGPAIEGVNDVEEIIISAV